MSWHDDFQKELDDKQNEIKRQFQQEEAYIDSVVVDVFGNPKGQELIGIFEKYFVDVPVADPEKSAQIAFYREGQNSVVRMIKGSFHRQHK